MDTDMAMPDLPELPVPHEELARYISDHPDKPVVDILEPYRRYENQLRTVYAQDRQNPILEDPYLNVLPLFNEHTQHITTRARNLAAESEQEKSRYIMPLPDDKRRPHGFPATVGSLAEFQKNFNVFSESSMVDMDWSNVVAAGSSVVNCLLPVPKEFNTTKRKLREYYHEKFCPASDVDLFLYGLNHDQAVEKIKQIERAIRDALLSEVTVVRTKYAITIASQYPVRHVQIVLRVYKNVSEILAGFDIDAAGGAYDGKQVYVTPRALASFITQVNHIDLSRRSPSYESRLSKYSHRSFEVYWPDLDRSRIDPTIFERSFQRTLGLARLLVLERLPTSSAREAYLDKRRRERGRPTVYRSHHHLGGNIKDYHEDEVADWLSEEEVSNYHTFTVPYGEKFNAKRIEKLCYTRDLLLNAEWNQPREREVYLHRHPAFFGRVDDVIQDCCGSCPQPKTEEEKEVAEKEAEIYISGKVSFLIDDPGRQQIGSFNPLTEKDWTDMAYVGNTARLCQSIVAGDVDDVLNWLSQPEADPNTRDYTGRAPLHLAVTASTPDVVKCLVDHGARLTARLADGRTALHLAAARGNTEMIKTLMERSIENEEAEEERRDRNRQATKSDKGTKQIQESTDSDNSEDSDEEMVDYEPSDTDAYSATTGSFIKIKKGNEEEGGDDVVPVEPDDEPDYYQVDVLAWDVPCSALHLAIVGGHEEAVKLLCDYGADSILPVKFLNSDSDETAALLTLTLALSLPLESAKSMARLLLKLGAVSSQAEHNGTTAFHRYVKEGRVDMVDTLLDHDKAGMKAAINHLIFTGYSWNPATLSPLHTAIELGDIILVLKLLEAGASPEIDFETWLKSSSFSTMRYGNFGDPDSNKRLFHTMEQPLVMAVRLGEVGVALELLEMGVDPNTMTPISHNLLINASQRQWNKGESVLDLVQSAIDGFKRHRNIESHRLEKPQRTPGLDLYLENFTPGTFSHAVVTWQVGIAKSKFEQQVKDYEKELEDNDYSAAKDEKNRFLSELIHELEALKRELLAKGAKTFAELHPTVICRYDGSRLEPPTTQKRPPLDLYRYVFRFPGDRSMTDKRRDGYVELFEAAWAGNLDHIKDLTLQAWGPEQTQPPLNMAIADSEGNTPFAIAFLRGHHEVAKAILEIVKAQWTPEEEDKVLYKLRTQDDDGEGDSDDEAYSHDSDDEEPQMVSKKVDPKFTIDNVGQVSMQVESHIQPLDVITATQRTFVMEHNGFRDTGCRSLLVHCFDMDDSAGLKLLLDMAQHWARENSAKPDEEAPSKSFTLPQGDFQWALDHGKTQLLGLVIKRTGGGIPLDHLVKKSGVKIKSKPRYYQGLTVYGKKRKDWATAGRNMAVKSTGLKTPPLLHAALAGSIESVEFFLSDAPNRLYAEFGKSKAAREDPKLKHLRDSPGGFDRAIAKWLGADNELVIHCAVLATPGQRANELLDYLTQTCPSALEKKNRDGDTPLMVACRLGRRQLVQILIAANADQSTRNLKGQNIVHAAVSRSPDAHRLRAVLDELDPGLRTSLFLQRTNLSENGNTPLQAWVAAATGASFSHGHQYYGRGEKSMVRVLRLLLEYSEGEGLDMLNAAGDTSLHLAIMGRQLAIAKVLVDYKPSLLYRENAVGRTPAEAAYETLTATKLWKPDRINLGRRQNIVDAHRSWSAEDYLKASKNTADKNEPAEKNLIQELGLGGDYTNSELDEIRVSMGLADSEDDSRLARDSLIAKQVIWDLCSTTMLQHPGTRRLVSLNEANDVARRLGEQETASRYFSIHPRRDEHEDEEDASGQADEDFVEGMLASRNPHAWLTLDQKGGEEAGFDKCAQCERYHD